MGRCGASRSRGSRGGRGRGQGTGREVSALRDGADRAAGPSMGCCPEGRRALTAALRPGHLRGQRGSGRMGTPPLGETRCGCVSLGCPDAARCVPRPRFHTFCPECRLLGRGQCLSRLQSTGPTPRGSASLVPVPSSWQGGMAQVWCSERDLSFLGSRRLRKLMCVQQGGWGPGVSRPR